jgi:polynucleotide 5'-kinase involved in rRNA processing
MNSVNVSIHYETLYRKVTDVSTAASLNVRAVRKWLEPSDPEVKAIIRSRVQALENREAYTCEWFQRHLLDFSRGQEKLLAITGPAGSGKTYLSGWIVERLQRPLGKKSYELISCSIRKFFNIN